MEMRLLTGLLPDVVLMTAGLAKRRGKKMMCRFAALSAIVNMLALYLWAGLAAEFGNQVYLEIVCAAGAKIFVIWIFIRKEEPAEGMLPVYLLVLGVSLCVHSSAAAGMFCELLLLVFLLYAEYDGRKKRRQEADREKDREGHDRAGGKALYLQTIEESYRKNRALMHDLNNHAVAMRALADSGKYEELVQYIDTFSRKVGENIFPVHSGSIVLDALLADKYHRASSREIPVLFEEVRYCAVTDDEDLCIVLGNLLDNAIEENVSCPDAEQRRIFLRIVSDENSLNIRVRNPLFHELTVKNGLPVSRKPDAEHHGMGLKNVRRVCDKYGGTLVWDVSEKELSVTVELFAPGRRGENQK